MNNKSLSLINKANLSIIILTTNGNESNYQVYILQLFNLRIKFNSNNISIFFYNIIIYFIWLIYKIKAKTSEK